MPPVQRLKDYKPQRRKGGPPFKYPWNKWLDGGTYRLLQGTHFKSKLKTMEHLIRRQADLFNVERRSKGLSPIRVSVFKEFDPEAIVVRTSIPDGPKLQKTTRS